MIIQCQRIDDLIDRPVTPEPWSSHVDTGKIAPVAVEDQHKTVFVCLQPHLDTLNSGACHLVFVELQQPSSE